MSSVKFHFYPNDTSPDLALAVGMVTLEWAMIDSSINESLALFWWHHHPDEPPPKSFDKRITLLKNFVAPLYENHPEAQEKFLAYIQEVKTANGQRDDIAHGINGKITIGSRTFTGLQVPRFAGTMPRYVHKTLGDIQRLAVKLRALKNETYLWLPEFVRAHNASLPNIRVWTDSQGWVHPSVVHPTPKPPR